MFTFCGGTGNQPSQPQPYWAQQHQTMWRTSNVGPNFAQSDGAPENRAVAVVSFPYRNWYFFFVYSIGMV